MLFLIYHSADMKSDIWEFVTVNLIIQSQPQLFLAMPLAAALCDRYQSLE